MLPMLKLEDLKVGMKVRTYQLDDIMFTRILLKDVEIVADDNGLPCESEGIIVFFGTERNEEFLRVMNSGMRIHSIYNTPHDIYKW